VIDHDSGEQHEDAPVDPGRDRQSLKDNDNFDGDGGAT
jgi:hypothetical protein